MKVSQQQIADKYELYTIELNDQKWYITNDITVANRFWMRKDGREKLVEFQGRLKINITEEVMNMYIDIYENTEIQNYYEQ